MRINLGSHRKALPGYVNVDIFPFDEVQVIHDLSKFPYPFETESAEEIVMIEFLEHLSFRITEKCLGECYRILKYGGQLRIQVPNIGKMAEYYVRGEICPCVPQKTTKMEDYKADPHCLSCGGKAKINTNRWRIAFSGAQKHEYDAHLNHFTKEILEDDLKNCGFSPINFKENIYKLIAEAHKV